MFTRTTLLTLLLIALAACAGVTAPVTPPPVPHVAVVAENLLSPVGMAVLADGSLLVAEEGTGKRDESAGVSLIRPDGRVGRLISGLPSSRDAGDLAGAPLVALSPAGDKIYLGNFNQNHLWTLPLTPEQQAKGIELPETPLSPEDLTPEMMPLNRVMLINPFDITFDPAGVPVVTDASGNGVAKETANGTTRFIHRFNRLPNPDQVETEGTVDPVPTGIERVGSEYFVTLTGGCPFPAGAGQLVAIDENRAQRTVVGGLNMPIDVAQGPDGTIWVLEFARFASNASCFTGSGYQARTGRLSRLQRDGSLQTVLADLNFPGAVLPLPDGSLYISEVFPGRILHVTFDGREAESRRAEDQRIGEATDDGSRPSARHDASPSARAQISTTQYDQVLLAAARDLGLEPYPGIDQQEGDTSLAQLGQALFFDPILSGDGNISCATCHHPALAFADGRALPIGTGGEGLGPERNFVDRVLLGVEASTPRRLAGVTDPQSGQTWVLNPFEGQFVPRNSPTVLNSALLDRQFWDSRVENYGRESLVHTQEDEINALGLTDSLAAQALFPVASLHEMAGATLGELAPQAIRTILLDRLRAIPEYERLFAQEFGETAVGQDSAITSTRLAEAIAAFERRLILTAAPWDDYLAGDEDALSAQQKQGALLFFGRLDQAVNCARCHAGDLFTDQEHHNLLVPQLGPGKGHGYSRREDWGRAGVTFDARDRYAFRTPGLRNVSLTAPYAHDGAFATLEEVISHHGGIWSSAQAYDPSDHGIPAALYSSLRPFDPQQQSLTVDPILSRGLPLSDQDIADLVAFLNALTDPAAQDLSAFLPDSVPSGLPLDPLPAHPTTLGMTTAAAPVPLAPDGALTISDSSNQPTDQPTNTPTNKPTDQPPPPSFPTPLLRDVARDVGLEFRHGAFRTAIFQDPVAAMGGGLCWIDYNNDGWLDLYLVNSHAEDETAYWQQQGGLPRNALYRNQEGTFVDASPGSGADLALRGNGCVAADLNGDGWWDLYVTADGPNALLWNNGDGTFTEGAEAAGVAAPEWNSGAVVGDLNGDSLPDLFVTAYIDLDRQIPRPVGAFPQDYYGLPDRLYLNAGISNLEFGISSFREVTLPAGLVREERGLGALLSDLDRDGDLDLYIANDGHPNRLYANDPWPGGVAADPEGIGFRLRDLTDTAQVGDSGSGMGLAGGDYDGDGQIDLFVTNWERELNALYRNESQQEGHLAFQYSTFRIGLMGLGNGLTGWGTAWLDLDQDTDLDLLVVNGRVPVTSLESDPQLVRYYANRLANGALDQPGLPRLFVEETEPVGLELVGPLLGRGSAVADYDNDGDLDVAVNTIAGQAVLLHNEGQHGNWLQVALDGFFPGAVVAVSLPDGRQMVRELYAGSSYLASEDPRLHFGLGSADQVDHLEVTWPDGRQLVMDHVPANQRLQLSPPP